VSLPVYLALGAGGGVGAMLRFLLDGIVSERSDGAFPSGTFVVNISGALALGLLFGAGAAGTTYAILGTGLLGGYTTFSTWMYETHRLAEDGERASAAANVIVSLIAGVLAVALGRLIGMAL